MNNLNEVFNFFENIPQNSEKEIFQTVKSNPNIKIERIISYGQTTPKDYWYDQSEDEFVMILKGEAKIKYNDDTEYHLKKGNSLYIKAGQKHRIVFTSNPAVWLAVFIKSPE